MGDDVAGDGAALVVADQDADAAGAARAQVEDGVVGDVPAPAPGAVRPARHALEGAVHRVVGDGDVVRAAAEDGEGDTLEGEAVHGGSAARAAAREEEAGLAEVVDGGPVHDRDAAQRAEDDGLRHRGARAPSGQDAQDVPVLDEAAVDRGLEGREAPRHPPLGRARAPTDQQRKRRRRREDSVGLHGAPPVGLGASSPRGGGRLNAFCAGVGCGRARSSRARRSVRGGGRRATSMSRASREAETLDGPGTSSPGSSGGACGNSAPGRSQVCRRQSRQA